MGRFVRSLGVVVVSLVAGAARDDETTVSELMTNTYALGDSECFAPVDEDGWGFCGALSCNAVYTTCSSMGGGPATVDGVTGTYDPRYSEDTCLPYLDKTTEPVEDDWAPKGSCDDTCTQRTDGVCSAAFLRKVIKGPSIKYAYCNEDWLVISSSGEPVFFNVSLNGIPTPPAATVGGVDYVTGDISLTVDRYYSLYYPLNVTLLPEGVSTNNLDLFDGSTTSSAVVYAYDDVAVTTYGMPDGAGVGLTVNGMQNWVTQNNRGEWDPPTCENDACNMHVGQGAGQPHIHGDTFSDTHACLYSSANYTGGVAAHPPIVAFAGDGHLIYGRPRYLSSDAPGFAAPLLDECGGHVHNESVVDEYGVDLGATYHYHTQIFDYVCGTGDGDRCADGDPVIVSSTGPLFCYRADLSKQVGSSAVLAFTDSSDYATASEMDHACCGMTDYYLVTGNVPNRPSDWFDDSTLCTVPADPVDGAYDDACSPGATMYSGWSCTPTCDAGFTTNGTTTCVAGDLIETASCVADDSSTPAPTPGPTALPTAEPAASPTVGPTAKSAASPTAEPAINPTYRPTYAPTYCTDDATWFKKDQPAKTCAAWVADNPEVRCKKKNDDGVKAKKACFVTCETCP